eukprot:tig00021726_g23259.t1
MRWPCGSSKPKEDVSSPRPASARPVTPPEEPKRPPPALYLSNIHCLDLEVPRAGEILGRNILFRIGNAERQTREVSGDLRNPRWPERIVLPALEPDKEQLAITVCDVVLGQGRPGDRPTERTAVLGECVLRLSELLPINKEHRDVTIPLEGGARYGYVRFDATLDDRGDDGRGVRSFDQENVPHNFGRQRGISISYDDDEPAYPYDPDDPMQRSGSLHERARSTADLGRRQERDYADADAVRRTGSERALGQPAAGPARVPLKNGDRVKVSILKGVSLLAKDRGGTSDPYVVVKYAGKEVGKTEVKKETLDPEFNQAYEITVLEGHDSINLTIFDWNRIQSHQYLGEANVSIADHLYAGMQGTEASFPLVSTRPKEVSPGDLDSAGSKLVLKFDTELPTAGELQRAMTARAMRPVASSASLGMSTAPQPGDKVHVEVLTAIGLVSADSNGLSDPFVVVKYNGKKLGETPVEKETLEPKWNWRLPEAIEVKGGVDMINFSVFDWNRIQSHKYLGEVDVPIRELKAGGDHEGTYPLKTTLESKLSSSDLAKNKSRLKLRFSCEQAAAVTQRAPQVVITEEPLASAASGVIDARLGAPVVSASQGTAPPGPPPGSRYAHRGDKVYLTLVQGDRLIARDSNGKSDPFVIFRHAGKDLAKTEVKKETLNPIWNHRVVIESLADENETVTLVIYDWDRFGGNDYMGEVEVQLKQAYIGAANTLKLPVTTTKPADVKPDELQSAGSTLTVRLEGEEARGEGPSGGGSLHGQSPGLRRGSSTYNLDPFGRPQAPQEGIGLPEAGDKVRVWLHEGRNMVSKDSNGKSDPYVVVTYGGKELGKSETAKETLDPVWNPPFRVPDFAVQGAAPDPENYFTLTVYDWNRFSKHKYMGQVNVPVANLRAGVKFKAAWPLDTTSPADVTDEDIRRCNPKLVLEIEVERTLAAAGGLGSRRPSQATLHPSASARSLLGGPSYELLDLDKLSKDKSQPPLVKGDRVQVQIIEGRDLPAKDSNGKSDPFVTIKVGGKQVGKSETIEKTLNPAWNYKVDVEVGDPMDTMVIEVWDWDRFGGNDYMGEIEVPLGKLRANKPLAGWVPLKTTRPKDCKPEEIKNSRLRLSIEPPERLHSSPSQFRIDTEGGLESAPGGGGPRSAAMTGDKFSFVIVEGERLPAKDSNGKSDPFVVVKIVNNNVVQLGKSEKIMEDLNPKWNFSVPEYTMVDPSDQLLVEVWDWDRWGTNDYMGEARLPLSSLYVGETFKGWVPLQSSKSSVKPEEIKASRVFIQASVTRPAGLPGAKAPRDKSKAGEAYPPARAGDTGRLTLVGGLRLPAMDRGGTSDPYAIVRWGSLQRALGQTETRKGTLSPEWNASFDLVIPGDSDELLIEVFDWNRIQSPKYMGEVRIPVSEMRAGATMEDFFPMRSYRSSMDEAALAGARLNCVLSIDPRPGQEGGAGAQAGGKVRTGDKVLMTVVEGRKLIAKDSNGKSDPFVIVKLGSKQISKSEKIKETLDPGWNHPCEFEVPSPDEKIVIEVWDWDRFGSNDYMGEVHVELRDLHAGVIDDWYPMVSTKPKEVKPEELTNCKVHLRFEVAQSLPGSKSRRDMGGTRAHGRLRVECIEARGLIAADINGKSDPYCVLTFGESGGKAGQKKTKTIYKNLSPVWRESFEFDVADPSEFLKIVLYDEDLIGSHDYLGEVTIGLDLLDGAANPLDNWFPLASSSAKKKVTGEVHLRIEHVPPPDAPRNARTIREMYGLESTGSEMMDPKQLRFDPGQIAQLDVIVLKARNLAIKDTFSRSSDPYCVLKIEEQQSKTPTIQKNLNPVWNAKFSFRLSKPDSLLRIEVFDEDAVGKHDFMGSADISVAELRDGEVKDQWLPLTAGETKERVSGDLCLRLRYVVAPEFRAEQARRSEALKALVLNRRGRVVVRAVGARDLPKMDLIGSIDPFLAVRLGERTFKTRHIPDNKNPAWGEEFTFEITEGDVNHPEFVVEVWDRDRGSADDFVGQCKVTLVSLLDGRLHDDWYPLTDKAGRKAVQGQVHLAFQFVSEEAAKKQEEEARRKHEEDLERRVRPSPVLYSAFLPYARQRREEEMDVTKGRALGGKTWGTGSNHDGIWFGQPELGRLRIGIVEARNLYGRAVALGPGYREEELELPVASPGGCRL